MAFRTTAISSFEKIRGHSNHAPNNRLFYRHFLLPLLIRIMASTAFAVTTVKWVWPGRYNMELELDILHDVLCSRCSMPPHFLVFTFQFETTKKWTYAESGQCWTTDDIRARTQLTEGLHSRLASFWVSNCACFGPLVYCRVPFVWKSVSTDKVIFAIAVVIVRC